MLEETTLTDALKVCPQIKADGSVCGRRVQARGRCGSCYQAYRRFFFLGKGRDPTKPREELGPTQQIGTKVDESTLEVMMGAMAKLAESEPKISFFEVHRQILREWAVRYSNGEITWPRGPKG